MLHPRLQTHFCHILPLIPSRVRRSWSECNSRAHELLPSLQPGGQEIGARENEEDSASRRFIPGMQPHCALCALGSHGRQARQFSEQEPDICFDSVDTWFKGGNFLSTVLCPAGITSFKEESQVISSALAGFLRRAHEASRTNMLIVIVATSVARQARTSRRLDGAGRVIRRICGEVGEISPLSSSWRLKSLILRIHAPVPAWPGLQNELGC